MKNTNRRLVLCLDGTWQNPYQVKERENKTQVLKPSNVLKLARAILSRNHEDGLEQITYYDYGIGAMVKYPGLANRMLTFFDSKLGGAWGAGFESKIEEGFRFLVHNHREGDSVFLFGFSRGAAQARALTQFIDWLGGIPTKFDAYFAPLYFKHYIDTRGGGDPNDVTTAGGRRPTHPMVPVKVELLAVWDTVMALGSRFSAHEQTSGESKSFHVSDTPAQCVRNARQALAVDERRFDFRPEIWRDSQPHQSLEQRWFAGCHANVGGGYVHDGLANIPFHWFLGEAQALGLDIDQKFAAYYRPFAHDKLYDSMTAFYMGLEAIRLRYGKGRRKLTGYPDSANLSLDPSVIRRLASSVKNRDEDDLYRPGQLIDLLAAQDDLVAYFESIGLTGEKAVLPEDVLELIGRAKGGG